MKYLARREYSRAELRNRLLPYAQPDENVDAVLDDLEQRNWLSDERATSQLINTKRSRFGTQRIAYELRQRGIAESLIDEALPALKESEPDAVREVWRKKFGTPPADDKERARQARFLLSRGFSPEAVFRMLRGLDAGMD